MNLEKKKGDIRIIYEFIGQLDCYLSIASLRLSLPYYCVPSFKDENDPSVEMKDVFHPLIRNCVANSISINGKSVLLTGSNMSGKTAFLRTVAINMIFAQTINTCFARFFSTPQMRLFTIINISDNLLEGKSYFFEEMLRIKDLISQSRNGSTNVFILDEVYKGTNTTERIASATAVLSFMAHNNIVFASTHDYAIATLLESYFVPYFFTETIENNNLSFDYKLKSGILKYGNAIKILEMNGYPSEIIEMANNMTKNNHI